MTSPEVSREQSGGHVRLWASITSFDFMSIGDDARRLEAAGIDGIHLDIADGHFVPFLTFGPRLARAIKEALWIPVEVHLLVEDPETYLRQLAGCRIERVAFHVESTRHPWRVASLGRSLGFEVGAALNPVTPVSVAADLGTAIDYINLLSTDHDFDGDRLLDGTVGRVRKACASIAAGVRIQVDGGVSQGHVAGLVAAGADDLVVGRAICNAPDWTTAVAALRVGCARIDPASR
jgi:ribulose-phosphate 3-epimerase